MKIVEYKNKWIVTLKKSKYAIMKDGEIYSYSKGAVPQYIVDFADLIFLMNDL